MDNVTESVADMDILQTGSLCRMDTPGPPQAYILRDYGLLECPDSSLSLSLTGATIAQNPADRTFVITDARAYSIMLRADTPECFAAWANALAAVTVGSDFRVARSVIAVGDNATVFRGVRECDNVAVAVKAVSRKRRPAAALAESHMSKFLSRAARQGYPNGLVRCLATYHTRNETHSVMEAVGTSLEEWVTRNGRVTDGVAKSIMVQLLSALDFLHDRGVVHGGVCCSNVLVAGVDGGDLDVRLGGFSGASIRRDDGWVPKRDIEDIRRGRSGVYAAPELLAGSVRPSADFWGMGVLLYRILVGRLPFYVGEEGAEAAEERLRDYAALRRSDLRRDILFRDADEAVERLSPDARSFLAALLIPRAEERMGARSMTRHPWLLLARLPSKRRSGSASPVDVFARGAAH